MDLKTSFQKLISENKLSHSYLLFGNPDGDFIKKLANFLENKKWAMPQTPLLDFFSVLPDEKNTIGIDAVKAVANFLWKKPLKSSRKTVILNDGECLTQPAQNAILKITEDPPANSLMFLLLKDPDVLVNPLISRFQKIYCPPTQSHESLRGSPALTVDDEAIFLKVQQFLSSSLQQKIIIIKEIAADETALKEFIKFVILELDKDPIKNLVPLRELCHRWSLISRFNTNKKLQLESWAQSFNG
ncbi:MAG: hypothetical protein ABH822_01410 [Patescibacteria group bacterium]